MAKTGLLSIHGRELTIPLIQGGMGVGVSLERLSGAVASCGGMGCISTADCGYREADFFRHPEEANLRALRKEIREARERSGGRGLLAVNAMVATQQYDRAVRSAVEAGNDYGIISAPDTLSLGACGGGISAHRSDRVERQGGGSHLEGLGTKIRKKSGFYRD